MAGFFHRLDRLVDRLIEVDALLPTRGRLRLVSVKPIFENLRYYTVLAFMWLGVRVLRSDGSWQASIGTWVLIPAVVVLGLLVVLQTTYILLAVALGVTSSLLPPRLAVRVRTRLRANSTTMKLLAYALALVVAALAIAVGVGLFSALGRAGLL